MTATEPLTFLPSGYTAGYSGGYGTPIPKYDLFEEIITIYLGQVVEESSIDVAAGFLRVQSTGALTTYHLQPLVQVHLNTEPDPVVIITDPLPETEIAASHPGAEDVEWGILVER